MKRLHRDAYYARLLWRGMRHLQATGQISTPRRTSLALVRWWQHHVTGPTGPMPNCCPRGAGRNCSHLGYLATERYGALVGWMLVAAQFRRCRSEFAPKGCF